MIVSGTLVAGGAKMSQLNEYFFIGAQQYKRLTLTLLLLHAYYHSAAIKGKFFSKPLGV